MVFDSIENAHLYYGLGERIEKALKFLEEMDFTEALPSRVDINGDNVYALIQDYNTKDPETGKWESHKKFIDIQFVISGSEDFGVVNYEYLDITEPYNEERDVAFYEGDGDFVQLHDGEFVILFPHDAHMPGLAIEESEKVRKVVIKVAVD